MLDCGHNALTYGTDKSGKKHCYPCCATLTRNAMDATGKATLYLIDKRATPRTRTQPGQYLIASDFRVTDWTGELVFIPSRVKTGWHNMAGIRYDVWFGDWHGVCYGEFTQVLRCKRLK